MSDPVKGDLANTKRHYDSSGRQEQARRTRWAVLVAARELFLADGYAATTIAGVATQAGVSVETVYKAFGNKAGLLKAVFDVAVAGDVAPIPVAERDVIRRIETEPDARRKFVLYGEHLAGTAPRGAPIQLLARQAAASDPAASNVWEQMKRELIVGMTMFAAHLQQGGHLREGVPLEEARDVLCAYMTAELYEFLVLEQGWAPERYGRWIAQGLTAALLP